MWRNSEGASSVAQRVKNLNVKVVIREYGNLYI